ncbi:MAG: hypothetical protein EP335_15850 [Alphaproteobacteria bacterium]|nr:MAG: hypothetical protein EP335_15850 [Alphaproteobacteria bacterium]
MTEEVAAPKVGDDVVRRVLAANEEAFEREDVSKLVNYGYIIALLNLASGLVGLMMFENGALQLGIQVLIAGTFALLAYMASGLSLRAGQVLAGLVVVIIGCRIATFLLLEDPAYVPAVISLVIGGFILSKMLPGLGSIRKLSETNASTVPALLQNLQPIVYGLAVLFALSEIWLVYAGAGA